MSGLHWDEGRLAQRIFANLASGSDLLQGYEQFDVFTDMEYLDDLGSYLEAYKLFPHLAAQYPNAVFILNTRNREVLDTKPTCPWKGALVCAARNGPLQRHLDS